MIGERETYSLLDTLSTPSNHPPPPQNGSADRSAEVLSAAAEEALLPETLDAPPGARWNHRARAYDPPQAEGAAVAPAVSYVLQEPR